MYADFFHFNVTGTGAGMGVKGCHRRANVFAPRLLESYCDVCGLLIAASPWPNLLSKAESIHACPVRGHYEAPKPPQAAPSHSRAEGRKVN
jgi:hypothetical protein